MEKHAKGQNRYFTEFKWPVYRLKTINNTNERTQNRSYIAPCIKLNGYDLENRLNCKYQMEIKQRKYAALTMKID